MKARHVVSVAGAGLSAVAAAQSTLGVVAALAITLVAIMAILVGASLPHWGPLRARRNADRLVRWLVRHAPADQAGLFISQVLDHRAAAIRSLNPPAAGEDVGSKSPDA